MRTWTNTRTWFKHTDIGDRNKKAKHNLFFFCKNNKLFVFLQSRTDNVSVQASFQTEMLQILHDKQHHYWSTILFMNIILTLFLKMRIYENRKIK